MLIVLTLGHIQFEFALNTQHIEAHKILIAYFIILILFKFNNTFYNFNFI